MRKLENLKKIVDTNLDKMDISPEAKSKIIQRTAADKKKLKFRRYKFFSIPAAAIIIVVIMLFSYVFGDNPVMVADAKDLMKGITPKKVEVVKLRDDYIKSQADFSIDLFKRSITKGKNSLISPISAYLALAMTANGADGNTLKEFKSVLGKYDLSIMDINKYSYSYIKNLSDVKSGKLNIADSIWYSKDSILSINRDFLQANADYYGAAAYRVDFDSQQTVDDINNWVKTNTGGLIEKITDKVDSDTLMFLINTLYFEADWQDQYGKSQIRNGGFKLEDGKTVSTEFMYSTENGYIKDDNAQGFIKPYKDNKYSFVALLPNEGISADSYAASLTGEKFLTLMKSKTDGFVDAGLPRFKSEYSTSLVDPLKAMGLKDCFVPELSDFSKMDSRNGKDLFIGDVLHKTFIQVDALGTKAGAVTELVVKTTSMPLVKTKITLDRPFVYAIVDNETSLPVFIGTMNNPQ